MKLQLLLSKILSFLADTTSDANAAGDVVVELDPNWKDGTFYKTIEPVIKVIDTLLIPIMIVIGLVGAIYGIVLGVEMSRAESTDKRGELKKRLINGAIGIVVMLILLILMKLLAHNAEDIAKWIFKMGAEK